MTALDVLLAPAMPSKLCNICRHHVRPIIFNRDGRVPISRTRGHSRFPYYWPALRAITGIPSEHRYVYIFWMCSKSRKARLRFENARRS